MGQAEKAEVRNCMSCLGVAPTGVASSKSKVAVEVKEKSKRNRERERERECLIYVRIIMRKLNFDTASASAC